MATTVVDLFDITEGQLKKSIRYHEESRKFAITDIISVLTGKNANDSARAYKDMLSGGHLTSINLDLITKHQFPGRGQKPIPVAPFVVILQACRSIKTII